MNHKLLIPALVSVLSGCATPHVSPLMTAGTGGGMSGSAKGLNNKKTSVLPQFSESAANFSSKKEPMALTPPRVSKLFYADEKTSSDAKVDDLENLTTEPKSEVLIAPSVKRYSNQKNKSITSGTPASSAGNPSRYAVSGENYKVLPFSNGFVERGIASWYGPDFHGEKTSNGEVYDMYGMTAAHKNLPIPSYVKVTNLKNKRSVVLRINDRGPFYADRVIDLSYAAAQKLDIHQPGTEKVQIEAIKTNSKEKVYLQLGVFSDPANAQMLQRKVVANKMPEPEVKEVRLGGKLAYRVQLGPIFSTAKVNEFNAKLAKMGISETWYVTENKLN